ncbi:hypothetical protein DJ533_00450 (plasmid) [Acinetobacter defluvii]|uniref:Uncharacterized protein n=1 Tax=Acinetobacter defluvii TaxID=1871111 RepID=A0A2S2F878_9GAMM|nr:hypothetical protein [Acinetobacter defluvii]AWL27186.1 hypothetical protein DJ533_00450 [Acinetobacter defluvii]
MEISRIKELALASGFKLKDQVNGELDLNAYVYDFAQILEREVLAQARSVFGQEAVTIDDTEFLDAEITQISESMSEKHYFDNGESEELEMLVAKAMKLGELYERKKWQEAKAIPEGFVLVKKELPGEIAEAMALERVNSPLGNETNPFWVETIEKVYKEHLHKKKWELWRDYKDAIKAQEQQDAS